jgi:hypothetical protein
LGDSAKVDSVEIHWPSGAKQTLKLPAVDRFYTVVEGKGITAVMCKGKPCAVGAGKVPPRASHPAHAH